MENVKKFLELNKFEKGKVGHDNEYSNPQCKIIIHDDYYEVVMLDTAAMYSTDLNIYWLIGVLTYYDLMPQFYLKK